MRTLLATVLVACSGSNHPVTPPAPTATTDCYAGLSAGMGQSARTIARRTVDPAAKTITEDVSHDNAGAHGARSFHVVMTIDGDHFTMTETNNAFTGTGTLVGEPWQWTSWTSTSQIPSTTITVESHDELTATGLKTTKHIKQAGKLMATTTDELKPFDCAQWADAAASLAVPILDKTTCDRACRNFATLKFWEHADLEISALPPADQAAAHAAKADELATKLGAGVDTCITACLGANNPEQTACWGTATTPAELAACDAK